MESVFDRIYVVCYWSDSVKSFGDSLLLETQEEVLDNRMD